LQFSKYAQAHKEDKTVKASAVASDGEFWVAKVLKTIKTLEADTKHISILIEVDEEDQSLRQKAQELVVKLKNVILSLSNECSAPADNTLRCPRISVKLLEGLNSFCSRLHSSITVWMIRKM
jgi:hypothetical protein